jgi:hypothetical protein
MSLLDEAGRVEAAADLLRGPPATLARSVIDACRSHEAEQAEPRALWNLLWLAGELSAQVDVYCALELLLAVESLFARSLRHATDERAGVAEMAFDFFFHRPAGESPLPLFRLDQTLASINRVLALDCAVCRRAALHGLGHMREQLDGAPRDRVDAVIDAFLRDTDSTRLAQYAVRARAGELL